MLKYLNILLLLDVFFLAEGEDNLTISTRNGLVLGSEGLTVASQKTFYAFRGIPYAEPPVGDLRFRAPVPANNWTGILNATVDRSICVQDVDVGSEDCLFLSVYTPKIDSSNLLPVMAYIYGGVFLEGDSRYISYGPDYFLEEDVVVVTFNYRLGVFGYLGTGDMAAPGNWGIKDQALVLDWVQDNIKNFGGDPGKVTIFGESAGSAAVSYLLQAPLKRELFRGAIMQSGVSLSLWALSRHPRITAFNLGKHLGIVTTNSTRLVEELRKVDVNKLHTASLVVDLAQTALTNPRDGLVFAPCEEPEHEGAMVLGKSHEHLKNGMFKKVPVIMGFTSQESLPLIQILNIVRLYLLTYDLAPGRLIPESMNLDLAEVPIVATKIRTHYFGLGLVTLSNKQLTQLITDDQFARPINEAVHIMSNYTKVYYYRFSYMGALGIDAGQPPRQFSGVGHQEDVNYLWRQQNNIPNPSESDRLTRRRLIQLWTNFAKTLNPTPNKDALLQNVTWNLATPQIQGFLDIGDNLKMERNLSMYSIRWWRKLFNDYGNPPYDTY